MKTVRGPGGLRLGRSSTVRSIARRSRDDAKRLSVIEIALERSIAPVARAPKALLRRERRAV
jgi:hypothetical protein